MKKFPTRVLAGIAGLTAAAALAGCGGGSATSSDGNPTQLRVGVFSADVTFSAFYAAIADDGELTKTLKDKDIELKIETIPSGSNLVAALAGGSVDAAIIPGTAILGVSAQGGKIVPLMNMFDGPSQQIIANKKLESANGTDVAKFDKGRWAFTRVGSISEISAELTAEAAGLTWKEQKRLPLGSGSETQAVLESNRADILSTSPANAAEAVASKTAYLIANPQDDESSPVAEQLNAVFAGSPKFTKDHPELTQDIVTALVSELSGLAKATDAGEVLGEMSPDFTKAVEGSWDLQWDYSKSGFSRATGGFSAGEIDQTVKGAQLVAVVKDDYTPAEGLFDNTFVEKAYADLGLTAPSGLS